MSNETPALPLLPRLLASLPTAVIVVGSAVLAGIGAGLIYRAL